jgi:beta-glucanase (GH16 family)
MKTIILLQLILCFYVAVGQIPPSDQHWILVWEDNFDELDEAVWNVPNNWVHHYKELQIYTNRPKNIFVKNGYLYLQAHREKYYCPEGQLYNYTSAQIDSKPLFYMHHGYIEARIKLPYAHGFFPAFWTWTDDPTDQEIDIFEAVPGLIEYCHRNKEQYFKHNKYHITSNIHTFYPANPDCDNPYASPSVSFINDYTSWHTYAMEWSPSRIIWYIDGVAVRVQKHSQIQDPARIILNFAIRADVPEGEFLPADMIIDYVRVYEMNKDCEHYIHATNYDFSQYDNSEKNFILIGNNGGSNSISIGDNLVLRASNFIEIYGNFFVPVGASLYMDVGKNCDFQLDVSCTQIFNPCSFDFSQYDNSIKHTIELGGEGCEMNITAIDAELILEATNEVILKPGVTLAALSSESVYVKIGSCNQQ